MKREARNKAHAPKLPTEVKPGAKNWAPSGGDNPVSHGPQASGATSKGSGRNTDLSTFSREQV